MDHSNVSLGYVILFVEDVPASLTFYEQAFGLTRRFYNGDNGKQYGELETGAACLAFANLELAKAQVEQLAFHTALEKIWSAIAACDKYVVETSPFKMWKNEAERPRVGEILHVLCDALRHTARLIAPFMPETSERIAKLLRTDPHQIGRLGDPAPAWFATFAAGHEVSAPEPLFPRIELAKA